MPDTNDYKYLQNQIANLQSDSFRRLDRLETIVLGNQDLDIPSLNDRLKLIDGVLDRINNAILSIERGRERERWILYGIAIGLGVNGMGIIGILIRFSQLMP